MAQPHGTELPETRPTPSSPRDTTQLSEPELRRLAVRRVRRKRMFWRHLFVYATVNTTFWLIWVVGGVLDRWIFPWPIIPTIFWGLFVLGEASDLFWRRPMSEAQIQHEVDRLRRAPVREASRWDAAEDRDAWWCDDEDDWWSWAPPARFMKGPRRNDRV